MKNTVRYLVLMLLLSLLLVPFAGAEGATGEYIIYCGDEITHEPFTVTVAADHCTNIRGGEGRIIFPENMKLVSIEYAVPEGFEIRTHTDGNIVSFLFWGAEPRSGSSEILILTFSVKGGDVGEELEFVLANGLLTDGFGDTVYSDRACYATLAYSPDTTAPAETTEPQTTEEITETETEVITTEDTTEEITTEETTKPTTTAPQTEEPTEPATTSHIPAAATTEPPLTSDKDHFPLWLIPVIIAAAALPLVIFLVMRAKKGNN